MELLKKTIHEKAKGFDEKDNNKVCKLLQSLYGLKWTPYEWNAKFNKFCESRKLERSKYNPCLLYKKR